MKVLVTGSRDWTDARAIERELRKLPQGTLLIVGDCPTGADAIAARLAKRIGLGARVYYADWDAHGRAGGPIRNAEMIREEHRAGDPIAFGLAFTLDLQRSRGTRDCVERARRAGIRMVEIDR